MPFLGHVVGRDGVTTDPDKIVAVKEWPTPESVTDVRAFLGLAGYYRSFVPEFATVAQPLFRLVEKNRTFSWSEECEVALAELKKRLTEAPVLGYPQTEGGITLDTDASDVGLGAVLSQEQEGTERVLGYASRALTKSEKNYCVTRKELLAIMFGLKKFRPYLVGRHFRIRTDHAALRWATAFREPEGQLARWLQQLDEHDYEIEHRPGRKHGNADGLSRRPCRQCGQEDDPERCRRLTTVPDDVHRRWTAAQEADGDCAQTKKWVEGVFFIIARWV